jgi:hypothetical protein
MINLVLGVIKASNKRSKVMKKLALSVLVCLALVGCEYEYGSIVNNSDYAVSGETTKNRKFTLIRENPKVFPTMAKT